MVLDTNLKNKLYSLTFRLTVGMISMESFDLRKYESFSILKQICIVKLYSCLCKYLKMYYP